MSRVVTTENAKVVREYVSPVTTIHWEPVSNSGVLTFHVNELLYINDEFVQMTPKTTATIPLSDLIGREYEIEVAAGVFQTVHGGLIMLAFKRAFEVAVEEGKIFPQVAPEPPTDPAVSDTIVTDTPADTTPEA